jgi:hypothetical protein
MSFFRIFLVFTLLFLVGCTLPGPRYEPSFDNVQVLKQANSKVSAVELTGAKKTGGVSIRGSTIKSPYGKDLIHYIQTALQGELEKAGLLASDGTKKITGVILTNKIDCAISTAFGEMKGTFSVAQGDKTLYQGTVEIKEQWESSFVGAIAIPRCAEMYPKIVQKFLNKLYSDPAFIAALKG